MPLAAQIINEVVVNLLELEEDSETWPQVEGELVIVDPELRVGPNWRRIAPGEYEPPAPTEERAEEQRSRVLEARLTEALAVNTTYIRNPQGQQQGLLQQVAALTKQVQALARLQTGQLDDISDTE